MTQPITITDLNDALNDPYPQRNELDRFGFSWILADFLGISNARPPKARCSWLHGWKWFPPSHYRYFWWDSRDQIYLKTHVVNQVSEAEILEKHHGFQKVIAGGLPFAYALTNFEKFNITFKFKNQITSNKDTCVYLPKCDYSVIPARILVEEMLDDRRQRGRFIFIVFGDDINNPSLMKILRTTNVPVLIGSCPNYKYDLLRTVALMKSFKYMITNSLGSHIPYCASLGLKIRISSTLRERHPSEFAKYAKLKSYPVDFFEQLAWYHSNHYFFHKYSDKFAPDMFSEDLVDWGRYEIGCNRLLSRETLKTLLGWDLRGSLRASLETLQFYLSMPLWGAKAHRGPPL